MNLGLIEKSLEPKEKTEALPAQRRLTAIDGQSKPSESADSQIHSLTIKRTDMHNFHALGLNQGTKITAENAKVGCDCPIKRVYCAPPLSSSHKLKPVCTW